MLLPLGPVGVGLAISIGSLLVGALALVLGRRVVRIGIGDLTWALLPPLLATLVATVLIDMLEHLLVSADRHGLARGVVLGAESVAFAAIFLGTMLLIAPKRSVALAAAVRHAVRPHRG